MFDHRLLHLAHGFCRLNLSDSHGFGCLFYARYLGNAKLDNCKTGRHILSSAIPLPFPWWIEVL